MEEQGKKTKARKRHERQKIGERGQAYKREKKGGGKKERRLRTGLTSQTPNPQSLPTPSFQPHTARHPFMNRTLFNNNQPDMLL